MNRSEALRAILDASNATHRELWLEEELEKGEEGQVLELCILFYILSHGVVKLDDLEWLDRNAGHRSQRKKQSLGDVAMSQLLKSDPDRGALMRVIRENQMQVIWNLIYGLMDGADYFVRDIEFRLSVACNVRDKTEEHTEFDDSDFSGLSIDYIHDNFGSFIDPDDEYILPFGR